VDPLESPYPDMAFGGIEEHGENFVVRLHPDDDPEEGESAVVAIFPKTELGLDDLGANLPEVNP
jgi:hypothetical protein